MEIKKKMNTIVTTDTDKNNHFFMIVTQNINEFTVNLKQAQEEHTSFCVELNFYVIIQERW